MNKDERVLFANLLKSHRIRANLNQEELAVAAYISNGTVRGLEQGAISNPHTGTIRLLANALHLSGTERVEFEAAAHGSQPVPIALIGPVESVTRFDRTPDFIGWLRFTLFLVSLISLTVVVQHLGSSLIDPSYSEAPPLYWAQRNLEDLTDAKTRWFWVLGFFMALLPSLAVFLMVIHRCSSWLRGLFVMLLLLIGGLVGLGLFRILRRTSNEIASLEPIMILSVSTLLIITGIMVSRLIIEGVGLLDQ